MFPDLCGKVTKPHRRPEIEELTNDLEHILASVSKRLKNDTTRKNRVKYHLSQAIQELLL